MTATADTALSSNAHPRLRMALSIITLIKIIGTLSNLPVLYFGSPDIPGTTPFGLLISATIVLSPVFAIAAFVSAVRHRLDRAIVALATIVVMDSLSLLPSVVNFWSEFPSPGLGGFIEIMMTAIFPFMALVGAVLAWRGERLGLATALVLAQPIFNMLGVLAFAISVSIHGF